MVYPLVALGVAGAGLMGASSIWNTYQRFQYMDENKRYWSRYEKVTGYRPRYERRVGAYNDYVGALLGGASSAVYAGSLLASNFYDDSYKGKQRGWNPYDNGYY